MSDAPELNLPGKILFWIFRTVWTSLVIAVPVVGVWVASSIAAYLDGPIWLVCLSGLLLFPGLPVAWQQWHHHRTAKKLKKWDRRVLTYWDKVVLRTLLINFVFLAGLLWRAPETAFASLSTRGDWMLDSIDDPRAEPARAWILKTADGLQWLYDRAHTNEFASLVDAGAMPDETPEPAPVDDEWSNPWEHTPAPDQEPGPEPEPEPEPEPDPTEGDPSARPDPRPVTPEAKPTPAPPKQRTPGAWPITATVHPAIASMPADAKRSVSDVGRWIADHESDPWLRVKAIHDFSATHVAYDAVALAEGRYPPQDAATVLRTGMGVCAGYANLSKAIADETGDHVVVIVGDSRDRSGDIAGGGHAWNAARIGERWVLFDSTWDAGSVAGSTFTRDYDTDYLFAPPAVMGVTHFPDDPAWQLRPEPISRGEFVRQPQMRPRFFHQRFGLVTPRRSQVDVDGKFIVKLDNPRSMFVTATFEGAAGSGRCKVRPGASVHVNCDLPRDGTYVVSLFSNTERYGTFDYLGAFSVHSG